MRAIPVLFLIIAGTFFILARHFYSRFLFSLLRQIPTMRNSEKSVLKLIAAVSVCFGAAFIILGVLMAANVAFPS